MILRKEMGGSVLVGNEYVLDIMTQVCAFVIAGVACRMGFRRNTRVRFPECVPGKMLT